MLFRQLFDPETSTFTYLLADRETREAVLIDPVREHVERDVRLLEELGLRLVATVETHVHADHVTGAWLLKTRLGSEIVLPASAGVGAADVLVENGDHVEFGRHHLEVRLTPGHTDGCATYVTDDHKKAFTGDALLIRGCGRTDFQQGDARRLFRSVHTQIFSLPDETELYPGHDYKGFTSTTVGEEKAHNPRLGGNKSEDDFAAIMAGLDLAYPKRIDVALPANEHLGRLEGDPEPWAPVLRGADGAPQIDIDWVLDHGDAVRLIDVREPDELEGPLGRFPGAEHVPLGILDRVAKDWEHTAPLVLICRSAKRSDRAALMLEGLGFAHVASMRGGMMAYRDAHPV